MTLGDVIPRLLDAGSELKPSLLGQLSGLTPEEQRELLERWNDIPTSRRLMIIRAVTGMAEDNIEMEFTGLLCAALADDDAPVRASAAAGLWETGDRIVIAPLVAMLESDESHEARAAAASALGHFAELAEEGKLIDRDVAVVRNALLGALEDSEEETAVRRRALEAIAPMRHADVSDWIRWAYRSGEPLLRQSAVYAMGRTCDPVWLPIIEQEFGSSVAAMRFEAANAARELADAKTLPHLHDLVTDDDPQVSLAAVHAIGGIGGAAARKLLKHYVEQGDPTLSEAAQEALRALEADEGDFSMLALEEP
ncbi:MAG: HEAT repeat domain-containing protein [Chloroflexota bacterium]|nr:HEAT repeat domain-containing protein [Chloroflexota bacterium]MDE2884790.1 HEAT repeat domain-containing protein [Chloroflexota bacterium]